MSKTTDRTASARPVTRFAPPTADARAALTVECLTAITQGRPLPAAVRMDEPVLSRPASVKAGIEAILAGG